MTKNKGMSPAGAAAAGAVIGAAVGAAAVVLSDEKNRKKVVKEFNVLKKEGQKVYSDMKVKVGEMTSAGEEKVEEAKKSLKSKL
jgi:gas vesicle protein